MWEGESNLMLRSMPQDGNFITTHAATKLSLDLVAVGQRSFEAVEIVGHTATPLGLALSYDLRLETARLRGHPRAVNLRMPPNGLAHRLTSFFLG